VTIKEKEEKREKSASKLGKRNKEKIYVEKGGDFNRREEMERKEKRIEGREKRQ